jgi:hypothetical protein
MHSLSLVVPVRLDTAARQECLVMAAQQFHMVVLQLQDSALLPDFLVMETLQQ